MQTDTDLLRDWEEAKEKTRIFAMQRVSSVTDLADWDKVQSEIYAAQSPLIDLAMKLNKKGIPLSGINIPGSEMSPGPSNKRDSYATLAAWKMQRDYNSKAGRSQYKGCSLTELQHRLGYLEGEAKRYEESANAALLLHQGAVLERRIAEENKRKLEMEIIQLGESAKGDI